MSSPTIADRHGSLMKIPYRRKDDNRRLRVEIANRAIASELTIA